MRVVFERTGGFAGIKVEGSLDSSSLTVPQARRLQTLLKKSGFFELPSVLESANTGADHFNYRVTVESEEGQHTVEAIDIALPASMRPLLNFLIRSVVK
jgi:hypothetical protein